MTDNNTTENITESTKDNIIDITKNSTNGTDIIINVRKQAPDVPDLEKLEVGDWIDLRAITLKYKLDGVNDWREHDLRKKPYHPYVADDIMIGLGVSMKLPEGYEGLLLPRSSTYKTWGLQQTNSEGVFDNAYKGNTDIWLFPVVCTIRRKPIKFGDRVCQFRIQKSMPKFDIVYTDDLGTEDRGCFGSTGKS